MSAESPSRERPSREFSAVTSEVMLAIEREHESLRYLQWEVSNNLHMAGLLDTRFSTTANLLPFVFMAVRAVLVSASTMALILLSPHIKTSTLALVCAWSAVALYFCVESGYFFRSIAALRFYRELRRRIEHVEKLAQKYSPSSNNLPSIISEPAPRRALSKAG